MDTRSLPVPGPDPHPVHGASRAFREGLPPAARRQYDLLAARLAHALDAGIGCDERLMRLPHPGRIAAHGATSVHVDSLTAQSFKLSGAGAVKALRQMAPLR